MSDDGARVAKDEDVLLVHGRTESGEGYKVVRKRGERIELGEMRTAQEGKPIHGELVRLKPREESERLFDVEVLLPAQGATAGQAKGESKAESKNGPAQVASDAYRTGWDAVFGRRSERARRLN
jgi:hypothetical protein